MSKLSETFTELRQANIRRLPLFKNKHGEPAHSQPSGSDWTDAEWFQAVIGELGEYANVRKKLQRGDYTRAEALPKMADELADVSTYLDILAFRLGIDLGTMIELNHSTNSTSPRGVYSDAELLQIVVACLGRWTCTRGRFELIDAVRCLDTLASQLGIDLSDAIVSKFNRVSVRVGCGVRMVGAS